MDRQKIRTDSETGIVSDPNDFANITKKDPTYPLELFKRVLNVSIKTLEIIRKLPKLDI